MFTDTVERFFKDNPDMRENVHFTGSVTDRKVLCEYYQRSRCFVLTSRFESWGIVLTEAAYYGNYIISTDVGCVRDLLVSDESGSIVDQEDSTQLAGKLQSVIKEEAVLSSDGAERLKKHCVENFSWVTCVSNLLSRLQEKGV